MHCESVGALLTVNSAIYLIHNFISSLGKSVECTDAATVQSYTT